jgi:hypothetical protein
MGHFKGVLAGILQNMMGHFHRCFC